MQDDAYYHYQPVVWNPNCLQATLASGVPKLLSQTQPQAPLMQICMFPSQLPLPQSSLMSLLVH